MCYKVKDIPIDERPRERLLNVGVQNLSNQELLSIIIRNGTKNKNVKEVALDLLKKYSLDDFKSISINQLINVDGIGKVKAIEIISCIEFGKRIFLKTNNLKLKKLNNAYDIWKDSRYLFDGVKQEYFYCLYFNNKQELIERKLLFMGTINKSITHPREVFKEAYRLSATSIVCMHNHPSNDITPSKADIIFTESLVRTGYIQGIPITDHIIVGDDNYYSFYDHRNILNL